jgi:hypothetical protein
MPHLTVGPFLLSDDLLLNDETDPDDALTGLYPSGWWQRLNGKTAIHRPGL